MRMNETYFKHLEEERKISIHFRFVQEIENKKIDRVFNFVRDVDEKIEVSLNRIKNNLEKELAKKMKPKKNKKNQPAEETPTTEALQVKIQSSALIIAKLK